MSPYTSSFLKTLCLGAIALTTAFGSATAAPLGTTMTYQGNLDDAGTPVTGAVDFEFTLWDTDAAGNQIGTLVEVDSVSVSGGVFMVQLDFGPGAFTGDARWLEISVRSPHDPGDTDPFTTLAPRQPLTATPYALHATTSPGAGLWQQNGSAIMNANPGFVGINRDAAATSAEYFGIQAPVTTGYGGMYIQTDGSAALPFYGYRTTTEVGWHYLDGTTGDWHLNLDSDRLTVTDEGAVGINNPTPGHELHIISNGGVTADVRLEQPGGATIEMSAQNGIGSIGTENAKPFRLNTDGAVRMTIDETGDVGIGTHLPTEKLDVNGVIRAGGGLKFGDGSLQTTAAGGGGQWQAAGDAIMNTNTGLVGVNRTNKITTAEVFGVHSTTPSGYAGMYMSATGSAIPFYGYDTAGQRAWHEMNGATGDWHLYVDGYRMTVRDESGNVGIGTTAPTEKLHVIGNITATGDVFASAVQTGEVVITGGADLSERFDIRNETTSPEFEPGMVVCIDSENPGALRVADRAYDRRVAGIISGAGGVKPGLLMGQKGSIADGEAPVALTGRVYCRVDASTGAIEPGDLLTTSDTPGHAMKVTDHGQAQGAILGKAMTGLASGSGLVLVLVTLQ